MGDLTGIIPPVEEPIDKAKDDEEKIDFHLMQDRMKRGPELYMNEFKKHFAIFKEKLEWLKSNPGKRDDLLESYMKLFSHVYFLPF